MGASSLKPLFEVYRQIKVVISRAVLVVKKNNQCIRKLDDFVVLRENNRPNLYCSEK